MALFYNQIHLSFTNLLQINTKYSIIYFPPTNYQKLTYFPYFYIKYKINTENANPCILYLSHISPTNPLSNSISMICKFLYFACSSVVNEPNQHPVNVSF